VKPLPPRPEAYAGAVEFWVLLRAGPQLLFHGLEIELTELVPVQVDALVGKEVRGGPEDPLLVVIGQDPDQGAGPEGQLSDGTLPRSVICGIQAARSNLFACLTSLLR
jgi:hypothetical protein